MGQEQHCRVRWQDRDWQVHALLESSEVVLRGELRLRLPLGSLRRVAVRSGMLELESEAGSVQLELGAAAEAWARRILHPPSLADKLGFKPGQRVALWGVDDPGVRAALAERGVRPLARLGKALHLVLVGLAAPEDLQRLGKAREALLPDGAVWALWPKGRKELREDDVRAYARAHGLVDVKVASVSAELSGLKLAIPRSARAAGGPGPGPRPRGRATPGRAGR